MIHNLKIEPIYYHAVVAGRKNFETRFNDRNFKEGDIVIMTVNQKSDTKFRDIKAEIGFVSTDYQKEGYVSFALLNMELIQ